MTVGPHSTKLPQSWDTESDQLGVPAILRIRAGPPVAAKDHTIRMNICNLASGIPRDDRSAPVSGGFLGTSGYPRLHLSFLWNMSLETKWPHMNKASINVKTIGTPLSWIALS